MPNTTITRRYNRDSRRSADGLGGLQRNPNPNLIGQNDEYDAYRHALTSAKIADRFGPGVAKYFGDAHEQRNPDADPRETNADKWNNNVGREEWARWKEARDLGLTTDSLEKWIYDAVKAGKTINDPLDPNEQRQWIEPPSNPFSDPSGQGMPASLMELEGFTFPFDQAESAPPPPPCPLVLDLDGDGTESIALTAGAYFDHAADGFAEAMGWVGADDGLLVWDRDANGRIESGRELFGNQTMLQSGQLAANGFIALAEWDGNADGKIDASDSVWGNLKVWKDADGDGFSAAGELLSMQSAGVLSINLSYSSGTGVDANGNTEWLTGSFPRTDSTTREVTDYQFTTDTVRTIAEEWLEVPAAIEALPDASGFGKVYDLHQAMVRDAGGSLQGLVAAFAVETDVADRDVLIEQILFKWTGAENVDPSSRGGNIDARRLVTLEAFMGRGFVGAGGSPNPNVNSAPSLNEAYVVLREQVYAQLMAQTHSSDLYDAITYSWNEASGSLVGDLAAVRAGLEAELVSNYESAVIRAVEFIRTVKALGAEGSLNLDSFAGNPTLGALVERVGAHSFLLGGAGADTLSGGAQLEIVLGYAANDTLSGGEGNDFLGGGSGDDAIDGGGGNDFIDGRDGNDTLTSGGGNDALYGRGGDDALTSNYAWGSSLLDGGEGNDLLRAQRATGWWNDMGANGVTNTFAGGTGNDRLEGSTGFDVYRFNRGDGQDTINDYGWNATPNWNSSYSRADKVAFGPGIVFSDLSGSRLGNHLVLKVNDPNYPSATDQITIEDWWTMEYGQYVYRIESFEFADGTVKTASEIGQLGLVMTGTSGADTLNGWDENNTIYGYEGNDTLTSGGGNDALYGGGGDDTLNSNYVWGSSLLDGGEGTDLLKVQRQTGTWWYDSGAAGVTTTFVGGASNDRLEGSTGYDIYKFNRGDGQDTINDYGWNAVSGWNSSYARADKVVFGPGIAYSDLTGSRSGNHLVMKVNDPSNPLATDQITIEDWWTTEIGQYVYRIESFEFADGTVKTASDIHQLGLVMTGTSGADTLSGWEENNTIYGYEGNDTLTSGGGNDALYGGGGDDTLTSAYVWGSSLLDGGEGNDLLVAQRATGWWNDMGANGVTNTFAGGAGNDRLEGSTGFDVYKFNRGDGQDTINDYGWNATSGWNSSYSRADKVVFGAGIAYSDLTGSRLGDHLVLKVNDANNPSATDQITIEGWWTIEFGHPVYRIESFEFADGTAISTSDLQTAVASGSTLNGGAGSSILFGAGGADILYGNDGVDYLSADLGSDVLNGGAGSDTMAGGAGDDSYVVDDAGDAVTENASEGTDAVNSSISYTLGANLENLTLTGSGAIDGTGNALDNVIAGNSGINTLAGGVGNDTYHASTGDTVTEADGAGTDLVMSDISWTLGANLESLTLTGTAAIDGTGNSLANAMTGNAANNVLDGGAGADTMAGGAGDDSYVLGDAGDVVTENAGEGTDTINSSISYTLGANLEKLTLTGAAAISGTGNSLANTLTGNGAANILDGGSGADSLAGGAGDDTYVVDNAGDVVTENAGEGADTVGSSISYTLGANLENLTLTEAAAISGTGNSLANSVTGNSADNVLDGGAGADTMAGGAGDDSYVVDDAGDVVSESAGEGADTVNVSFTYTLGANVENLLLTGGGAINGSGNSLDNVLTGNSAANTLTGSGGNDTLNGGAGGDTMIGGTGNDAYYVDNASDAVTENASEGTDTVYSTLAYTLGANLENLTLIGASAINGTGDSVANVLTGNSAANTLAGGTGNDTYYVGTGDTVNESSGAGTDTVMSDIAWTLGSNLENLTLIGAGAINGTGNTAANVITGNAANNTLDGGSGADSMSGGAGNDTYIVDNTSDTVTELAGEGIDLVNSSVTYTLAANVENLTLTGTSNRNGTGNAHDNVLNGNSGTNTLTGAAGNDTLDGKAGADTMAGGLGDDVYFVDNSSDATNENASEGIDIVNSSVTRTLAANLEHLVLTGSANINGTGNGSANLIRGNGGNNTLNGAGGFDALEGGAATDTLTDSSGGNYYHGGGGTDTLAGGTSGDLLIGGTGNDTLNTGNGKDVIIFNVGDGQDSVNPSSGIDDTVSLGGTGIAYGDLTLQKTSNNLILNINATEKLTFVNWYSASSNKNVLNLQIVAEAMIAFDANSSDPLLNKKVQTFDFQGLAGAFDAARAADPGITTWALSSALSQFHLSGSDTEALGGDLAYYYGRDGALAGIGFEKAQDVVTSVQFGQQAQTLRTLSSLQEGVMRLGL